MSEFSDPSDSETEDFSSNKLTVTESLLLATLPSSAISLTHFLMPRHNRENVTEISKTVTVTEIVKASSEKHPRSCEVTITNVESGSNHPISVKISHLHDSHNTQKQQHHHRSISTRTSCPPTNHQPVPVQLNEFKRDNPSPNIVIKEDHPDAVSLNFDNDGRAAMFKSIYSTHTEDRKMIAKVRPEATFKQVTDNIIDLEFTHPILIDQKTAEQDKYRFTDFSKTQTPTILYYRPFFEDQQKNLPLTESSVGITVTPFLPRKAEGNVVKVIPNNTVVNLTLKTDELENNAEHHSENKWHKQFQSQSSARIPDGMYSQKATSERKTKIINYVIGKCDSEDKSQLSTEYITAAFTESEANENISLNKTTKSIDLGTPREITRSFIINKSAKKFENHTSETNATYTKQLPRTHLVQDAKELSEMTIIKPDLITQKVNENEISVAANSEEEEVPLKPPRKTKYVMEYADEKKRVSVDHASQTSLLKTSTPLTALEKKNKYVEDLREGDRIIPTTTKITKSAVHHDENLYVKSPRRIPSSPIIVINQSERKSSADLLEQIPRTQRKSTVTDIDWFSAFNMKEPMSPRSLKCPLPIDALRKNESISIESLQPTIRSSAPLTLLKTSQINLDDVFSCLNTMDFKRKKCQCNACRTIATPDEVREILDERNQTLRGKIISCEESRTPSSMENFTPVADINLDDIFVLSLVDPDSQRGSSIITKHEDDNEGTSPQRSLDENVIVSDEEVMPINQQIHGRKGHLENEFFHKKYPDQKCDMSVKQSNNDEMQNVVINISIENIFSKSLDVITSTGSRQTEKISISKEIPFDIKASINNTHQVYENKVDLSEPCIEVIRGHNSLTSSPEYFVSIPSIKEDETPMMLHGDALSKREDYDPNMHNILAYFKRGHYYKEPFETQRMCNENIHIQEEQKWIHINEFYDESPFNKTSDKIDVKDFVDDIISESMDEAALFSESQELRRKQNLNTLKCSLTDTSADRKRLQRMAMISGLNVQLRDQTKHKQNYLPSTSQSKSKEHKETNNTNTEHSTFDDLLKTEDDQQNSTFRSTLVENENLLKSLILYCSSPSSSQNTHERTISRINSCDFNEVPVNTKETLTSCLTSDSKTEDVTFVSSASLIINDSQCSIKDNSEDEQLLRLVFSSINKNTGTKVTDRSTLIQDHAPVVNSIRTTEQIEEANVGNETVVSKDSRSDNEILEVEIGPEYFVISGNYSLEIGKTDPLGKMLQKLQYGSDIARLDFSITSKLRQLLNQCIKEKIMGIKTSGLNLSLRARTLLESNDPADEIHSQVNVNKYNDKNPQGNVNFCTAENKICGDLLRVHFEKETRLFSWNENMTQYGPAGGYESGKTALRCYIEKFMNASVNESEMVILPSINAAYDMISYCLFESEDVIMTSTPTYARLITSCMERAQCKVVGVELNLERPQLNLTDYERVLNEQKKKGETVRAVILINPHNPLGVVFPKDDVVKLCEWASRKNLSVLVDESFCQCVHGTNFFRSFLTYRNQIENSNNVIYMWSLSKDFGLPGAKVSMIYSSNTPLIRSLSRLELIHPVSTIAQEFTVKLLSDFDWLHSFHVEKLNRLRAHYHFTTANLRHLDLPFVNSEAGIFVLVDFRKHLTSCTHTEELHLWKRMTDNGLFLSPGFHMLCHQPGWMRIVFSCTKDELIEGFVRLHRMFGRSSSVVGTIRY